MRCRSLISPGQALVLSPVKITRVVGESRRWSAGGLSLAAIGGAEGDRMLRSVALGHGCHHLLVESALIGPLGRDERAVWPLAYEANGMEPGRALRRDARRGQLA